MPYDEGLAERIRGVLDERPDVVEKKMFGGVAFMVRGHMAVGIVKDDLMVRVGGDVYDRLLGEAHARPMDFTGRPMKGFLFIEAAGLDSDRDLARWVGHGVDHALSLAARRGRRPEGRRPGSPENASRSRTARRRPR